MTSAMEWIILVLLHRASGSLPDRSTTGCLLHGLCYTSSMMKKRYKTNRFQALRAIAKEYGLPGLVRGYVHNGRFYLKIRTK